MMRTGQLTHKGIIEQPTTDTVGSGGSIIEAWEARTTAFMSLEELRGRELFDAQQKYGEVTARVIMYHQFGVTPDMRILFPRAFGSLSSACTGTALTDLGVSDGVDFPRRGDFLAEVGDELINVTAVSGGNSTAWTIERGEDGTAASTHDSGSQIKQMVVYNIIAPEKADYENNELWLLVSERI